jgi:hypothetical protein
MNTLLTRYMELMNDLVYIRWLNQGEESKDEDKILEKMDQIWERLDAKNRSKIASESPRSRISSIAYEVSPSLLEMVDDTDPESPPRRKAGEAQN